MAARFLETEVFFVGMLGLVRWWARGNKRGDGAGEQALRVSLADPTCSFMRVPKGVRHNEWTKGETIIYVYGLGPLETTYVNPADDLRQKASRKE